jgi:hypothetical protein
MKVFKVALAALVSIAMAMSTTLPTSAAVWYSPDTNQFEERAASPRGGSPIK